MLQYGDNAFDWCILTYVQKELKKKSPKYMQIRLLQHCVMP